METDNATELSNIRMDESGLVKLVWEDLGVGEHFTLMKIHRDCIMQIFQTLGKYIPELPEEVVERHDLSKFAFSLYPQLGSWDQSPHLEQICELHLHHQPHHPVMWSNRHTPAYKITCLEKWLCVEGGGGRYDVEISTLGLLSEDMARAFLYESFLDMVAWEWLEKRKGLQDVTDRELVSMKERYLSRYSFSDRAAVKQIMMSIQEAE